MRAQSGAALLESANRSKPEQFLGAGGADASPAKPAKPAEDVSSPVQKTEQGPDMETESAPETTPEKQKKAEKQKKESPTAKKEEPAPLPPMPERQVWQAKRGRKKVELEVGGMGLSVSAGGKHLDNYLYMSLGGWGEAEGLLQLDLAEGKVVKFTAPEAEEIAEAMTAAARVLAKAKKTEAPTGKIKLESAEAKAPAAAAEDAADAPVLPEVGDKLRCLKTTTIREASEMESASVENLAKGSVIEVLEIVELDTGFRVRFSRGWSSMRAKSGTVLFAVVDRSEPEAILAGKGSPAKPAKPSQQPEAAKSGGGGAGAGGKGRDLFKESVAEIKKAAMADAAYKKSNADRALLSDAARKYRSACGESWPTAAISMESPYCSCRLTVTRPPHPQCRADVSRSSRVRCARIELAGLARAAAGDG